MSFAPVYNEHSRALILGTWPSPKSREMSFYYGHPQNRFWPMLAALTGEPVPAREDIEAKNRSSCAMGWPCGIRWKAVPSPARRMRPSGTWCPMILPVCWQKRPLRLFFATGPRHIRSIQSISSGQRHPSGQAAQHQPRQCRLQAGKLREIWQKELSNWILP